MGKISLGTYIQIDIGIFCYSYLLILHQKIIIIFYKVGEFIQIQRSGMRDYNRSQVRIVRIFESFGPLVEKVIQYLGNTTISGIRKIVAGFILILLNAFLEGCNLPPIPSLSITDISECSGAHNLLDIQLTSANPKIK
jgi:hypothetical protein